MNKLYEKYLEYDDEQLFRVIIEKDNYQKEAVEVAQKIIEEKNLQEELEKKIKAIEEEDISNKLEQFRRSEQLRDINLKNIINIKISDVARFEGVLSSKNIEFFREDKNIGGGIELYPSQNYYFSDKDFLKADKICVSLGLTDPYTDIKPIFKFELKVLLIIIAVIALLLIVFI